MENIFNTWEGDYEYREKYQYSELQSDSAVSPYRLFAMTGRCLLGNFLLGSLHYANPYSILIVTILNETRTSFRVGRCRSE